MKFRFSAIIVVGFLCSPFLLKAKTEAFSCQEAFDNTITEKISEKNADMDKLFGESPGVLSWNRWILKTMFATDYEKRPDLVKVFSDFDIESGKKKNRFTSLVSWGAYPFLVGKDFFQSLWFIYKDQTLSPFKKLVIYPMKALFATGMKRFFGTLVLVASLTGGDVEIQKLTGFYARDPFLTETNPSGLRENEIILLVRMDTPETGSDKNNNASYNAITTMNHLARSYPKQIKILDLSNDNRAIAEGESFASVVAEFAKNNPNIRIKRMIVGAHGSPDIIHGVPHALPVLDFSKGMRSLAPLMASKAEIYFDSCNLVASEEARANLRLAATSLLPHGGKVVANRFSGISETGELLEIYSKLQRLHPSLHIAYDASIFTQRMRFHYKDKQNENSPLWDPLEYIYEVPG